MMNNKESDKAPNLSPETNQSIDNEEMTMDKVYINIDNKKLGIDLENNSTTSALMKLLPLELSMNDLNGDQLFKLQIIPEGYYISLFAQPAGAFLVLGIAVAVFSVIKESVEKKKAAKAKALKEAASKA